MSFIQHSVLPVPDKGISPQSTSDGLQCKISQLFKLPVAAEEQWHCGTHPFPPGGCCQERGRMDNGRLTVITFDEVHLYNLRVPGTESLNYNQLWISEVSLNYCCFTHHSVLNIEYFSVHPTSSAALLFVNCCLPNCCFTVVSKYEKNNT